MTIASHTSHLLPNIGSRMHVDGDKSMQFVLLAILINPKGNEYQLSWLHEGKIYTEWIAAFRCTIVEDER